MFAVFEQIFVRVHTLDVFTLSMCSHYSDYTQYTILFTLGYNVFEIVSISLTVVNTNIWEV